MQKRNPACAKKYDALIQDCKQQRDALTGKPTQNLQKFLDKLEAVCPEPQEMDNMTEVVVKKWTRVF